MPEEKKPLEEELKKLGIEPGPEAKQPGKKARIPFYAKCLMVIGASVSLLAGAVSYKYLNQKQRNTNQAESNPELVESKEPIPSLDQLAEVKGSEEDKKKPDYTSSMPEKTNQAIEHAEKIKPEKELEEKNTELEKAETQTPAEPGFERITQIEQQVIKYFEAEKSVKKQEKLITEAELEKIVKEIDAHAVQFSPKDKFLIGAYFSIISEENIMDYGQNVSKTELRWRFGEKAVQYLEQAIEVEHESLPPATYWLGRTLSGISFPLAYAKAYLDDNKISRKGQEEKWLEAVKNYHERLLPLFEEMTRKRGSAYDYFWHGIILNIVAKEKKGQERMQLLEKKAESFKKAVELRGNPLDNHWYGATLVELSREKGEPELREKAMPYLEESAKKGNIWGCEWFAAFLLNLANEKQGEERTELLEKAVPYSERLADEKGSAIDYLTLGSTLAKIGDAKQGEDKIKWYERAESALEKAIETRIKENNNDPNIEEMHKDARDKLFKKIEECRKDNQASSGKVISVENISSSDESYDNKKKSKKPNDMQPSIFSAGLNSDGGRHCGIEIIDFFDIVNVGLSFQDGSKLDAEFYIAKNFQLKDKLFLAPTIGVAFIDGSEEDFTCSAQLRYLNKHFYAGIGVHNLTGAMAAIGFYF